MYGTDEGSLQYNAVARGRTSWSDLTPEQRTINLVLASSAIDAMFEPRFPGVRTGGLNQENAWPRLSRVVRGWGIGDTEVPVVVEWATYELAYQLSVDPAILQQVQQPGSMIKRETVGPLTTEYAIPTTDGEVLQTRFPLIEGMLSPLFRPDLPEPSFLVI